MSAITVGGDLVHYEVLGRGRPVILLHGWVGSWRYWIPTMQQLHLKYRVYAIDLFGYGDSAKNPERYTIAHQIAMLSEFMVQLGIPKAAMVAHGLGAQVAAEFAAKNTERVARLLLASAPLFDPGNLDTRVPPGAQVLLTTTGFDARQALDAAASTSNAAAVAPATAATTTTPADPTVSRRPDIVISANAATPPAPANPAPPNDATLPSAKSIDRAKLEAAAMARAESELTARRTAEGDTNPQPTRQAPPDNPLYKKVGNASSETLLGRCFKKSEPQYEKLGFDLAKMDDGVLPRITASFDAGRMLDTLRMIATPAVIVHGEADPLIPDPGENVWNYLTSEKEDSVLPVPLPGVRHFPMLEHEAFIRLINNFLELPDISKLELKERWRRRSR